MKIGDRVYISSKKITGQIVELWGTNLVVETDEGKSERITLRTYDVETIGEKVLTTG